MSDQSISIPPTTLAASSPAIPPARPVAARTKLLLEGPVFATLLRLAAPNILNLIAFVAVITVGSSRVDLQACKLEYSIVSPK